jgi:DNA-binding NtrC family response regulator
MNVLVVDDDQKIREALQAALDLNGHEVATAGDGIEALWRCAIRWGGEARGR